MRTAPPRWLVLATFSALAALLYFPLHVRYQNPDQDYPALALIEFVRGGWEPSTLQYPSALTNLLHAAYAIGLAGHGWWTGTSPPTICLPPGRAIPRRSGSCRASSRSSGPSERARTAGSVIGGGTYHA